MIIEKIHVHVFENVDSWMDNRWTDAGLYYKLTDEPKAQVS